jgi:hypothetical protein
VVLRHRKPRSSRWRRGADGVEPRGKAYGVGTTDERRARAEQNAREAGLTNVEFLRGRIDEIPLLSDSVDVFISNDVNWPRPVGLAGLPRLTSSPFVSHHWAGAPPPRPPPLLTFA